MAQLPLFPVTTVGSWPRSTSLIRALRAKQSGEMSDAEFDSVADQEVISSLRSQEEAGIDIVTDGEVQMLGTSGTMTTLAAVHLGLARYDRGKVDGAYLSLDDVSAVSRRLVGMDNAARAAHPCIGVMRAALVVYGCAILEAICRLWPAPRLRVADRGLREGILLGLMAAAAGGAAGLEG